MSDETMLASLRVLDLSTGPAEAVGRLLSDLGADVLKIEPRGETSRRRAAPSVAGFNIAFLLDNANKRCAQLDPTCSEDRRRLIELAGGADIVIDSGNPGTAAAFGTSLKSLAEQFGHLVALSVTDFGTAGPYSTWQATDAVLYAMSSALSRTGPSVGTPVPPPTGVASATAAVQATWVALVGYYDRLRCGKGEYIDFSRFEAVLQTLDPPFGAEGQAAVGLKSSNQLWRGRPRNQQIYPIFECRDGQVRICLLSSRQWRSMWTWLGEPEQFADPSFDTIAARYAASAELNTAIGELFAPQTMAELVAQGQARGVPIAAVLTPTEALAAEHFRAVGALSDTEIAPGVEVAIPVGPFVIDDRHHGYRRAARASGADDPVWVMPPPSVARPTDAVTPTRPFDGLRILDLGVIVAGGELGRLFADLGAEVIKIESRAYPDGLRQAPAGKPMSRSWALTHRNEFSLGLDLRQPSGAELFGRLVQDSDAVFANFKPGTLAALGFSYQRLRELNPRIVLAESSAFGDRGPWSAQMGYGPLVRAATGITQLWRSPDAEPGRYYDATTIFPDHVVARLTAIATLAVLIRRVHTGFGGHVHISQAEAAINQLAQRYVAESAKAAGLPVIDDQAVHAVFPCAGDDEWCVISIERDRRTALGELLGYPNLSEERQRLISTVGEWTAARDNSDVAAQLQEIGIPAAPMNRAADLEHHPQVAFRGVFTELTHPLLDTAILTEAAPAPFTRIPRAPLRPAPMPGEHTRTICQKILALKPEEIDGLVADGVLFTDQTASGGTS
ncbi:MAG: CoA transferase [Mycolicibacterium sp.]|uniref:CaiB/BaiF CoA-transferase family protein n=1 Tax=Mycolicibacterium sp. TaxID=2320850 RepID=UPI003D0FB5FF